MEFGSGFSGSPFRWPFRGRTMCLPTQLQGILLYMYMELSVNLPLNFLFFYIWSNVSVPNQLSTVLVVPEAISTSSSVLFGILMDNQIRHLKLLQT